MFYFEVGGVKIIIECLVFEVGWSQMVIRYSLFYLELLCLNYIWPLRPGLLWATAECVMHCSAMGEILRSRHFKSRTC